MHRPFEAPHNATTIRDRFLIPDANIGRSTWAVIEWCLVLGRRDSARRYRAVSVLMPVTGSVRVGVGDRGVTRYRVALWVRVLFERCSSHVAR